MKEIPSETMLWDEGMSMGMVTNQDARMKLVIKQSLSVD
jgi:hypothetical protein